LKRQAPRLNPTIFVTNTGYQRNTLRGCDVWEFRREVIVDWKKSAQTIRDENKKNLLRESRREAVTILEDAARTNEEFEKVTIIWDALEVIEEWRVEKWEIRNTDDLVNYPIFPISTIIPPPLKRKKSPPLNP